MRVIVNGASGRMGGAVIAGLEAAGDTYIAVDAFGGKGLKSIFECREPADVVIDFSSPDALSGLLQFSKERNIPIVLATTGYSEEQLKEIEAAAENTAIFKSANMSLGINVLKRLVQAAAKMLGNGFDCEIIETHHNKKKDAPSGTALLLYDALNEAYESPRSLVTGRQGADCTRQKKEIGIHALRGGTVPGIHEVGFYGTNEVITLSHSAQSREIFAQGAIRAAMFMKGKAPGLYDMEDLLAELQR